MATSHSSADALTPRAHRPTSQGDTLSIPYLVAAAFLMGLGVFLVTLWVTTFAWPYFGGIGLMAVGALMLFSPRAGANSA